MKSIEEIKRHFNKGDGITGCMEIFGVVGIILFFFGSLFGIIFWPIYFFQYSFLGEKLIAVIMFLFCIFLFVGVTPSFRELFRK